MDIQKCLGVDWKSRSRVLAVDKACSSVQATHERCLVTNIVPTVVECTAHTKPAHHQQVVQLQWDPVHLLMASCAAVVEGLLRHDRYVHVFDFAKQLEVITSTILAAKAESWACDKSATNRDDFTIVGAQLQAHSASNNSGSLLGIPDGTVVACNAECRLSK